MNSLESVLLSYLFNSLWQVPLLFSVGWLMARFVRGAGMKLEHRVWVATLLLQSLIPAFSAVSWPNPRSLWTWFGRNSGGQDPHVSVIFGAGEGLGGFHLPAALLTGVAIVYGATCVYFLARFVWRCASLALLHRDSVPIELSQDAKEVWLTCSRQFEIEEVSIGVSARIFAPVTLGFRKKLVLLPTDFLAQLPQADLHTVIAHEFAHLRRNDFLKNLLYEFLLLPISYHPLLWRAHERVTESREIVCDAMVAQISGRKEYARSLLRLASLLVAGTPISTPHAIGIFDANTLERRLMRLTQTQRELRGVRRGIAIAACLLLGAAACGSALALATNVHEASAASGESPKSKDRQIVSAGEMVKYLLHKVTPVYPQEAKEARIQGKVVLDAIIGKTGDVENLTVVSGPDALQQSALDAVRQWKYKPFLIDGEPTEVETTINIIYSLAD